MVVLNKFDPESLSDVLPLYYKRLFPFDQYFKWLSYGDNDYFSRREFSFTYNGDIYVRYNSFESGEELMNLVCKKNPCKIDIGAIFNAKPKMHTRADTFEAIEKEVVIDIDMTDYDDVRTCCKEAAICEKCWKFMIIASKIIDTALRVDIGLNHLLWVFSGRRGIHCWISDERSRKFTTSGRSCVANFLCLLTGGTNMSKKVHLMGDKIHRSVQRAYSIAQPYFKEVCLIDQDILGTEERITNFLKISATFNNKDSLSELLSLSNSEVRWKKFLTMYKHAKDLGNLARKDTHLIEEIVLQYLYPRLDIHVTKGLNHLLKSPFCIHPKTGKVCVPFTVQNVDKFNPNSVPTIDVLVKEINEFDEKVKKEEESTTDSPNTPSARPRIKDYKKTSLYKGICVFEQFVRALEDSNKQKKGRSLDF